VVAAHAERTIFLLTREAKQRPRGFELVYWGWSEQGPVRVRLTDRRAIFFAPRDVPTERGERSPTDLVTMDGRPVDAVAFTTRAEHRAEADRLRRIGTPAWEDDVKPHDRALMERFVTSACTVRGPAREHGGFLDLEDPEIEPADVSPKLRVASFDIEAEGPHAPIYSVAIVCEGSERAFVRGSGPPIANVLYEKDERATLAAFLAYVRELDPDVLIGWNVIEFDVSYLETRCQAVGLPFVLGRGGERSSVLRGSTASSPSVARVAGRVVLDGIATMRAATWSFESYGLEHVSQVLLGRGKKIDHTEDKLAEIQRMYREDLPALVAYNLEDCRLARDVFAKAHLLSFAIERQRLTGLTMDRRAGAVSAFDHLYLPRLHQRGRVAPSSGVVEGAPSPGGYVMGSAPGLYDNVLVLDFKSLYPSIIRTFLVDPLGLCLLDGAAAKDDAVQGFAGARFSRDEHILPGVIETLWRARDEAKKIEDEALSRAIKILMNSFYGVLGTPACRFFDPRLASSITLRGHEILRESRRWLEERGLRVIYGDTDSLFVLIGKGPSSDACAARGRELAAELNAFWRERIAKEHRLESALELQLDACFARFLMPTVRGGEQGSKKRYAGVAVGRDGRTKLVIKGLEAVRTDWTPLARSFQRELLRRVFADEPYKEWIRALTDDLFRGRLDDELVYTKRLRREMDEYGPSAPPHVAAARLSGRQLREIAYVVTTRGPEPVVRRRAAIDYQHYLEKQLAPAADAVLPFLGERFMSIGGRQLSLF
jgi:DNA polymerase-2